MLPLGFLGTMIAAEYRGQVRFVGPPAPVAAGETSGPPVVLPLPGAIVTATQGDKKLTAVTDQQGVYDFPDLPDGTWQLDVDMIGFNPAKQEATPGSGLPGPVFQLKMMDLDQIQAVAAPAEPAAAAGPAVTAAPTPTPGAPATPSLTASVAAANAKAPANGKKGAVPAGPATAFQRTNLASSAGSAPAPAEPAPAPEVTSELSQRAADGFLINGSAQNGASSPFAQNPAFGNNRKNGPRLYTYSLVLNDSNSALNAANFSQNGQATIKPPTNNLTGGFNFQGPLKIPHLIQQRNAPSFGVFYQRTENRGSSVSPNLMPNATERTGDFSQALYASGQPVEIFDPASGLPFAGNIIPNSRLSQSALYLLQYYPLPNFNGDSAFNYQVPLISNTHTDSLQTRVSKSFKRKNFVSGVFGMNDTRRDSDSQFNFLDLTRSLGMQATASYRRTYTPRFYGTFTYQFSRQSNQTYPFFSNVLNVSGAAGITGNDQTALNWGPPGLGFSQSGFSGLGDASASIIHNQTSAYGYLGTWNHGRHNIQFGGDFRWQQFNTIGQSSARGSFSFNGLATQQTSLVNGVSTPVQGTGYDFADFLLGVPDQSAIAFGNADKYLRAKTADLYFTDDWKVSPGFSATLGIRWEYTSPITELYGRLVNLDVAPGFSAISPVVASNPTGLLTHTTYPNSLIRADRHEFIPRPGFAWRPFPASSMVIRGGYAIGYNTGVYNGFANQMAQQSPLSKSLSVLNSSANPLTLNNGFYAPPNQTTNTIAVDPHFKIGYSQIWNLSVQRDLPFALVMQATYTGTKGTHLLQAFVPNTYPSGATNPCPTCPSSFTYYTSNGNSTRQAGTLNLRRRLHNGFTASLVYTYSKSIDDVASLGGNTGAPRSELAQSGRRTRPL